MIFYNKQQIETILNGVADRIDISDTLFNDATKEYQALGKWIDKTTKKDGTNFIVHIYPQGSFALGTVIKPITDEDDYDLDLVCEIINERSFTAEYLKKSITKRWLTSYKRTSTEIEEKKRCWHVEYDEVPNFHMDVIPAISGPSPEWINITDKDEDNNTYRYMGSNPEGYIDWFLKQCKKTVTDSKGKALINEMAIQDPVKKYRYKSNLQKAIQLMKRHRDIMFKDDSDDKPISIIITTLAAQLYNGEQSVYDTLSVFMNNVEKYLNDKIKNGNYYISNPSLKGENFADKWIIYPQRRRAFFAWLECLQSDLDLRNLMAMDRVAMGKHMKKIFGDKTGNAIFTAQGIKEALDVRSATKKVDLSTGALTKSGILMVPPSHHHGKI